MRTQFIVIAAFVFAPLLALAQADMGGNGGKILAQDFSNHIARLDTFFSTSQAAKKAFPEVNPAVFAQWKSCLTVRMLPTRPVDKFGMPQDAVNWKEECLIEVYDRAWASLDGLPDVKFSFALHEMLGLMDIEIMKSPGGEQDYSHSSKIVIFVQPVGTAFGLLDIDFDEMNKMQRFRIQCYYNQLVTNGPRNFSDSKRLAVSDVVITYDPNTRWHDQTLNLVGRGDIHLRGTCGKGDGQLDFGVNNFHRVGPHDWDPEGTDWNRRKLKMYGSNSSSERIVLDLRYSPELAESSESGMENPATWTGSLTVLKMHFPRSRRPNVQVQGWMTGAGPSTHIQCTTEFDVEGNFVPADDSQLRLLNWILNLGYDLPEVRSKSKNK